MLGGPAGAGGQQQEQQLAGGDGTQQQGPGQGGDALSPWAVLPGYMRPRETAAIEALSPDDETEGEGGELLPPEGEPSTSGRPWGPFQQEAQRRRAARQGSSLREAGRQVSTATSLIDTSETSGNKTAPH